MRFEVIGAHGQVLGNGRDLDELKGPVPCRGGSELYPRGGADVRARGAHDLVFRDLPDHVDAVHAGVRFRGYPALEDRGRASRCACSTRRGGPRRSTAAGWLASRCCGSAGSCAPFAGRSAERSGSRFAIFPAPASPWTGSGSGRGRPAGRPVGDLVEELLARAVAECCLEDGSGVRGRSEFERRIESGAPRLESAALALPRPRGPDLRRLGGGAPGARAAVESRSYPESLADFDEHLASLVYRGFLADTPLERLAELPRYLEAARGRLAKLPRNPARDLESTRIVRAVWTPVRDELRAFARRRRAVDAPRVECRWMLEELRVSQFMQEMGTRHPVSVQRIERRVAGRPCAVLRARPWSRRTTIPSSSGFGQG